MPIYTIGTFEEFKKIGSGEEIYPLGMRVVGFYTDKTKAEDTVINNVCDLWETIYDYAVIERIDEGIYKSTHERQFYKYNMDLRKYESIEEPKELKHFAGFTMG